MGEVRVLVRLTNASDAVRLEMGEIGEDQVRQCEADSTVHTGSVATVIPRSVVDLLGVTKRGQRTITLADGHQEVVDVTHAVFVEIMGRDTVEECLVLGDEVLIGHTVLEKTGLFIDYVGCRLVPNPAHPDQTVLKVKGFGR